MRTRFASSEAAYKNLRQAVEALVPYKDTMADPQMQIITAALEYAEAVRCEVELQYEVRVNGT